MGVPPPQTNISYFSPTLPHSKPSPSPTPSGLLLTPFIICTTHCLLASRPPRPLGPGVCDTAVFAGARVSMAFPISPRLGDSAYSLRVCSPWGPCGGGGNCAAVEAVP